MKKDINDNIPVLRKDEKGLALVGNGLELRGDFTQMLPRLKLNNLRGELLVKAAKIKDLDRTPIAIDATAGLGEDSILLAAAGFEVYLFEYNKVISALLQDALIRAAQVTELKEIISRMHFNEMDSVKAMTNLQTRPDVVFLDPMFPERQKSALVKKKFQLLQHLEQPCTDEKELLQAAILAGPQKIIIKRPAKGPYLDGQKPSYSIEGKGIRYDCIMLKK